MQIVEVLPIKVEKLFDRVSDHETLGKVLGVPVRRSRDGDGHINGLGSVRTMGFRPLDFDETITAFEPPRRIEYRITRGSPLRNHRANVVFSPNGAATEVTWTIDFETRPALLGVIVKRALSLGIRQGLRKLARAA
ncbi:MAG: SRPBCC family protein [Panacagrimonas sp.]